MSPSNWASSHSLMLSEYSSRHIPVAYAYCPDSLGKVLVLTDPNLEGFERHRDVLNLDEVLHNYGLLLQEEQVL